MSPILDSIGSVKCYGWGASSSPYWALFLYNPDVTKGAGISAIDLNSSGSLHAAGYLNNSDGTYQSYLLKTNSDGVIDFKKTLSKTNYGYTDFLPQMQIDSSSNIYTIFSSYSPSTSPNTLNTSIKLSSSPAVSSEYRFYNSTYSSAQYRSFVDTSNGDLYGAGSITNATNSNTNDIFVFKSNASGTVSWSTKIVTGATAQNSYPSFVVNDIKVDTSGNVYVGGYIANDSTNSFLYSAYIAKFNSSGTLQWQKKAYLSGYYSYCYGIALDSSGNVYMGVSNSEIYKSALIKFNSSGTVQWQRMLTRGSGWLNASYLYIDSSDNIYWSGYDQNNEYNNYSYVVAKYNTSGNIQWQRRIKINNIDLWSNYNTIISNNQYLYLGFQFYNSNNKINSGIVKVNPDGSTLGSIVYGSQTVLIVNGNATEGAGDATVTNATYTSSSASIVSQAGSNTSISNSGILQTKAPL